MINKLIEKYKKLQKESYKKYSYYLGQDQSIVLNVTEHYRYECNRYSKFLQDLEKIKTAVRKELYNSDCTVAEYNGACERLGVDTDE